MKLTGFKKYIESIGGGSFLPTSWTGTEGDPTSSLAGHPVHLPGIDIAIGSDFINIPTVKIDGIVKHFEFKENPIKIELANGAKISMDFNQYKNISGDLPIIPRFTKLFITFQRNSSDTTMQTSPVQSCVAKFIGDDFLKKSYGIKNANQMP